MFLAVNRALLKESIFMPPNKIWGIIKSDRPSVRPFIGASVRPFVRLSVLTIWGLRGLENNRSIVFIPFMWLFSVLLSFKWLI